MAANKRHRQRPSARLLAGLFVGCAILALPAQAQAAASALDSACRALASRLSSVSYQTCVNSGLKPSEAVTVRGRPILSRDFAASGAPANPAPPRVLLMGGIHGDELTSISVVMQWMEVLRRNRQQAFEWRVIPCVNPDGLLAQPAATRVNANGVDLNRNFPTPDWNSRAQSYWETQTARDPRRYPGRQAQSEPETRWLVAQIQSFHPDAIISVHAPFGVLDYDGPQHPPQRFGYLSLRKLGTYPGSLGNFITIDPERPVITLELPHAGVMPSGLQIDRIWNDMQAWLQERLPQMHADASRQASR